MPAHITHELFAKASFRKAFGKEDLLGLDRHRHYWVFGAQGPDFFLHNHRTKPSGLVFGKLLHTDGYGTFVANLLDCAVDEGHGLDSELGAFIAGFVTHAVLDRWTHPFINYFAGWVEPDQPQSTRFYNCHAFLERIIDVLLLKIMADTDISEYDFFEHVNFGPDLPPILLRAIVKALESTFVEFEGHRYTGVRVGNAYSDTIGFYDFTNPIDEGHLRHAFERDGGGADPSRRFLALFHPRQLPDLDYLNGAHKSWNHPGDSSERHSESFVDLFERAAEEVVTPLLTVGAVLAGNISASDAIETIGNQNLSDGSQRKRRRKLDLIDPLPLDGVLASFYEAVGGSETGT